MLRVSVVWLQAHLEEAVKARKVVEAKMRKKV